MELQKKTVRFLDKKIKNDLEGRLVVITGATGGIGLNAVRELLYLKAKIIMAVRNEGKGEDVKNELLKEFPDSDVMVYSLDLSSMDSIKKFVMKLKRNKLDIYAFVNNAGTYSSLNEKTEDGHPLVFGTNFYGTYALTERLIPYFKTLSHDVILVNTSSIAYKKGNLKEKYFTYQDKGYNAMKSYCASKLAITKYSIYLANMLMDSNIRVMMSHPGVSNTGMVSDISSHGLRKLAHPFTGIFQKPEKSALSIPYAVGNDFRPGTLVGPKFLGGFYGYPKENKLSKKAYIDLSIFMKRVEVFKKN